MAEEKKEKEEKKTVDQLLEDAQGTITITRSEAYTLAAWLNNCIISAQGNYAVGVGSKVTVDHLQSVTDKLKAMRKERWNED